MSLMPRSDHHWADRRRLGHWPETAFEEMTIGMPVENRGAVPSPGTGLPGRTAAVSQIMRAAVDDMAGMANLAETPVLLHPNIPVKHYDPNAVYTLVADFEGLRAGAVVVDASLPAGILSRLVRTGEAIPFERPELGAGVFSGEDRRPDGEGSSGRCARSTGGVTGGARFETAEGAAA